MCFFNMGFLFVHCLDNQLLFLNILSLFSKLSSFCGIRWHGHSGLTLTKDNPHSGRKGTKTQKYFYKISLKYTNISKYYMRKKYTKIHLNHTSK